MQKRFFSKQEDALCFCKRVSLETRATASIERIDRSILGQAKEVAWVVVFKQPASFSSRELISEEESWKYMDSSLDDESGEF